MKILKNRQFQLCSTQGLPKGLTWQPRPSLTGCELDIGFDGKFKTGEEMWFLNVQIGMKMYLFSQFDRL